MKQKIIVVSRCLWQESSGLMIVGLIWIIVFFVLGAIVKDPDLWWHLKNGELITKVGILRIDPYSYTMPSFPYVDHEWLSNVIAYLVFSKFGYWGLVFVFAIVSSTIWFLIDKKECFQSGLIFLLLGVLLKFGGVRFQVLGWVFLMVLLQICFDEPRWRKMKWGILGGTLLWVNLHGSFPLGLVVIGLARIARWIRIRKIELVDLMIFLIAIALSLVNPYGWRVWEEILRSMTDPMLGKYVAEWHVITPTIFLNYWFLLLIVVFLGWRYRKEINLEKVILVAWLVLMSIKSTRHTSLSALGLVWLGTELLSHFRKELFERRVPVERIIAAGRFFAVLAFLTLLLEFGIQVYTLRNFSDNNISKSSVVEWMRNNSMQRNIFAPYDWGGYLIFSYPEALVFIDGRMPSWRDHVVEGESNWAMKEYEQVLLGDKWQEVFEKYRINTVIWYAKTDESREGLLVKTLEDVGWVIKYKDGLVVVMTKN